jgi:hypothetical protein
MTDEAPTTSPSDPAPTEPPVEETPPPNLGIPTILPLNFCFRADDSIPQAAQVISPHVRPRILNLWISIQGAMQLAHSLMDACFHTPKEPTGIIAFKIPAHLFREGEEPMLTKLGKDGKPTEEGSRLVGPDGAPV